MRTATDRLSRWILLAATAACCACGPLSGLLPQPKCLPKIELDTADIEPSPELTPLATFLLRGLTNDGRLDEFVLDEEVLLLDKQLRLLAVTGPSVTPQHYRSHEARLAYWLNARTAWAMKLAILWHDNCGSGSQDSARLDDHPVPVDGRRMTLAEMDRKIYDLGGWVAVAAAPGATYDRARLPDAPFTPERLDARLHARLTQLLKDPRRVVIDPETKTIQLPPVLYAYRDEIVADYERKYHTQGALLRTALLDHADSEARLRFRNAVGYEVRQGQPKSLLAWLAK